MKLFEGFTCKGKLLSNDDFLKRLRNDTQKGIDKLSAEEKQHYIDNAEKAMKTEIPILKASVYKQFAYTGNRTEYQGPYYSRRNMLTELIFAELLEKKKRFTEKILDLVWLILEESTWVIPAHNKNGSSLLYEFDDVSYVDLFSASTAAVLALSYVFFKEDMNDGLTDDMFSKRLEYEIENRILLPFEKYAKNWWYIGHIPGHKLNNWNPWIHSNILFILAIFEKNEQRKEKLCDDMLSYTDNFLDTYGPDGGCDEGPSYWGAAGASYFDFLDLLYKASDGKIDKLSEKLVYNMGDYIRKMYIGGGYFVNFADCGPKPKNLDAVLIYRFAKRTGNKLMMDFACSFDQTNRISYSHPQRSLYNMIEKSECKQSSYKPNKEEIMEDTQVYVFRNDTHFIAIKGGHNREAHNHNDIGHFVLFEEDTPLLIDAGSDTYSKKTFSDERYTLWNMQSSFHNLPEISGYMQLFGIEYRASDVSYDKNSKCLSMQLKNAYPKEANISSYIRKLYVRNNELIIEDDIDLKEEGDIIEHLLLLYEPSIRDNFITVKNTQINIDNVSSISYEKISTLNCTGLNTNVPERGNMADSWDSDFMFRIKASAKTKNTTIRFTINRRD